MERFIREFIKVSRLLNAENLTFGYTGNMSRRVKDGLIITRRGANLRALEPEDLIFIGPGREVLEPYASSELPVHREVLKSAGALLHCHAPASLELSYLLDRIVPPDYEGLKALGRVPVLSLKEPSASRELAEALKKHLKERGCLVVRAHGLFCAAGSLEEAFYLASLLESSSRLLLPKLRGGSLGAS
ncbi:MAG: aldolase [Aquificae bacterium]|nr:aldolase [Aquificota bacterium]